MTCRRVQAAWPQLRVVATTPAVGAEDASNQRGAWELLVAISLGFTASAVINTFAVATAARRREYADLRLAGATTGQVHRLALNEVAITVAVALLIGAAITAIVVGAFSVAQDGTFRLIVDWKAYAAMLGGVGALGLLAGALPAGGCCAGTACQPPLWNPDRSAEKGPRRGGCSHACGGWRSRGARPYRLRCAFRPRSAVPRSTGRRLRDRRSSGR